MSFIYYYLIFYISITNGGIINYLWPSNPSQAPARHPGPKYVSISEQMLLNDQARGNYDAAIKQLNIFEAHENSCWEEEKQHLVDQCGNVGHAGRSRLAIRLTNCHLKLSGLDRLMCNAPNDKDCLRQLADDGRSYDVYNNFFTHLDNICNYMKADNFRQSTLLSVKTLYEAADDTSQHLQEWTTSAERYYKDVSQNNDLIIENQLKLLDSSETLEDSIDSLHQNHEKFVQSQEELIDMGVRTFGVVNSIHHEQEKVLDGIYSVQTLTTSVYDAIDENSKEITAQLYGIQDDTHEINTNLYQTQYELSTLQEQQKHAFGELSTLLDQAKLDLLDMMEAMQIDLNLIKELDVAILHELFYVSALFFYLLMFFIFWILTSSSKRIHSARIPCYFMLICGIVLESRLPHLQYLIRRCILLACAGIITYNMLTFKDLVKENNKLLNELLREQKLEKEVRKTIELRQRVTPKKLNNMRIVSRTIGLYSKVAKKPRTKRASLTLSQTSDVPWLSSQDSSCNWLCSQESY